MKKLLLLLTANILLLSWGCMESSEEDASKTEIRRFHSDNAELQEAKAIARKIYEGIEKVEKEELTREEFQSYARPLQQKLNALIINMGDEDLKKLEQYRNHLMERLGASVAGQQ